MKSKPKKMNEGRDTAFEVSESYAEMARSGFRPVQKAKATSKDGDRFPPTKNAKAVPQEPLGRRIAQKK